MHTAQVIWCSNQTQPSNNHRSLLWHGTSSTNTHTSHTHFSIAFLFTSTSCPRNSAATFHRMIRSSSSLHWGPNIAYRYEFCQAAVCHCANGAKRPAQRAIDDYTATATAMTVQMGMAIKRPLGKILYMNAMTQAIFYSTHRTAHPCGRNHTHTHTLSLFLAAWRWTHCPYRRYDMHFGVYKITYTPT